MVTVAISEPDVMSVAAFGSPYKLPAEYYPLTSDSFGQVMDHLWSRLQEPFTVEILDTDGSRTTGTIDLRPPALPAPSNSISVQNTQKCDQVRVSETWPWSSTTMAGLWDALLLPVVLSGFDVPVLEPG